MKKTHWMVALTDNEAAVKLIFDNVRNIAIAGIVAALAGNRLSHVGTGFLHYFTIFVGVIFAMISVFLFILNFNYFRFRVRDMMGWRNTWLWLGIDTLHVFFAYEAATTLIFAKLS
ncbi:MAG: hypothetical protein K2Q15_16365 [Burkholderiales bacterium]|nr:hypothetical protein [Burkholderiales bacterium]